MTATNAAVLKSFYDEAVSELSAVRPAYLALHSLEALPAEERPRRTRFMHRFPPIDTWRRKAIATIDTLALLLAGAGWAAEAIPVEATDQEAFEPPCRAPFGYACGRVEPSVAPARQRLRLSNPAHTEADDADALTSLMWTLALRTAFHAETFTRFRCLDANGAPLTGYRMDPSDKSDEAAVGDPYWWCNLVTKPADDDGDAAALATPAELDQRDAAEAAHILVYWLLVCHPLRGAETKASAAAIVASIVRSSAFGLQVAGAIVPKVTRTTIALGTRKGCVEPEMAVLTITDATVAGALLALGYRKPSLWGPVLSAHPRFGAQAAPMIGGVDCKYMGLGCIEESVGGGLNWLHLSLMVHSAAAFNQVTSLGWYAATAVAIARRGDQNIAACFDAASIVAAWNAATAFHDDRTISGKGNEHGNATRELSPLGMLMAFRGWRGQLPNGAVAFLTTLDSVVRAAALRPKPEAALLASRKGGSDGDFSGSWLMANSSEAKRHVPYLVWPSPESLLKGWLALRHTVFAPPIPYPPPPASAASARGPMARSLDHVSWRNPAFAVNAPVCKDDEEAEGEACSSDDSEGYPTPRCDHCHNRERHSSARRSSDWRRAALPATTMLQSVGAMRTAAALAFRVKSGPCGTSALGGLPWDVITEVFLFLGDWCAQCGAEVHTDVDRQLWYAFDQIALGTQPKVRLV